MSEEAPEGKEGSGQACDKHEPKRTNGPLKNWCANCGLHKDSHAFNLFMKAHSTMGGVGNLKPITAETPTKVRPKSDEPTAPAGREPVRVIMGTMTIGPAVGKEHIDGSLIDLPMYAQTPPSVALAQLKALLSCREAMIKEGPEQGKFLLDTASVYQNGCTETVIGDLLTAHPEYRVNLSLHTKCNAMAKPHRSLSKESVLYQANKSLKNLQVSTLDIFYLHSPDIKTNIDEALEAVDQLHKEGKIQEFGLSNYPAWKVASIWHRCKEKKMLPPTVYQGPYNAITRSIEFEATACFRELGIRSYHFNPLAGGMLSGKHKDMDSATKDGSRFGKESPISGQLYSERYWNKETFAAVEIIRKACASTEIPMAEAAIRWLLHHSILDGAHNDGIILGASTLEHMQENLAALKAGPLPQSIVDAYDRAWDICKGVSSSYFRGYGTQPGSSDIFLSRFQQHVPKSSVK
eukprot:gb/GEZN01005431.1/.p1 GENE.gb/GEZN01005431.1/~~gb/GEZN01005431.1/.p1  ORF type:complete len:463 (+),score=60.70 gb/GEZN01005431.1/:97-1485(+)